MSIRHDTGLPADDEVSAEAARAAGLLRDLVPCSAFALCAWNPFSGHRHTTLASDGYSEAILSHANDGFVRDDPTFLLLRFRDPRALRWRDLEREWRIPFARTFFAERHLIPAGFHEGTTACLRLPDGRYTGSLHVSWSAPREATAERRERIERLRPVLAGICDLLRAPKLLADEILPEGFVLLFSADGVGLELPNRPAGPLLAEGGPLRARLLRPGAQRPGRRFLWIDDDGGFHRVEWLPCRGGATLASERPIPAPEGLTVRELEVLHLVATGASNPEIARRLFVSPRTISTHLEHLLAKLACVSRSSLAARAVAEGLLLADPPGRP